MSSPVVFPEALATYKESDPATVFPWLVPITQGELEAINDGGWNSFEDRLEQADVDLFDLNRSSIV